MNPQQHTLDNELLALCKQGAYLHAVKLYKNTTGLPLATCRQYVTQLAASYNISVKEGEGLFAQWKKWFTWLRKKQS